MWKQSKLQYKSPEQNKSVELGVWHDLSAEEYGLSDTLLNIYLSELVIQYSASAILRY